MEENIKSIRLRKDQISLIKKLNLNLSEWIREKIDEELLSPKEIKVKVKKMEKELKKWKEIERFVLQRNTKVYKPKPEEIMFLQETKVLIDKNPGFLAGRIKLFNNSFPQEIEVKRKKFLELLDKSGKK